MSVETSEKVERVKRNKQTCIKYNSLKILAAVKASDHKHGSNLEFWTQSRRRDKSVTKKQYSELTRPRKKKV